MSISKSPILRAASEFGRRIKCIKYFSSKKRKEAIPFTSKSNWVPPDSAIPVEIHTHLASMEKEIEELTIKKHQSNISKGEIRTLKNLKNNDTIVIKKADKGSATVIMNKKDYIFEANRQLSNEAHYVELSKSRQSQTTEKIHDILLDMKENLVISEKQYAYLKPPNEPRPRRFYLLPKIHKSQDKWTVPDKIPPGRPIVSNCNSESEKVAEFVDKFLKLKSSQHPAYLKNTQEFIQSIENINAPSNALFITLDVESMYTNINHVDAIKAFEETFRDKQNHHYYDYVKNLLSITLQNNDFEFNGKTYIQKSGVSMGIKYAPSLADIFMAKWEQDALKKCQYQPLFFKRFLDDIFMLWTHGIAKFWEFFDILNNHHPSIKLTATISEEAVNFLDTTVYKYPFDNSILCAKVYFKPTDTHALLQKKSFHPKSTFKGIIKSQILRFSNICTLKNDFHDACTILYKALLKRKYSKRWLRKVFHDIKDEITRNARSGLELSIPGSSKWGYSHCDTHKKTGRCITCNSIETSHNFKSWSTDNIYPMKGQFNCASSNLIYLITCKGCNKQYVGETERQLRKRFLEHRRAVLNLDETYAVAKHFKECHLFYPVGPLHRKEVAITITPLEQIPDQGSPDANKAKRLDREYFWIDTLETFSPYGLNDDKTMTKTSKRTKPAIPFIVPYSSTANSAAKIAQNHFNDIQLKFDLHFDHDIIVAYQKHKNLRDLLVSTKL